MVDPSQAEVRKALLTLADLSPSGANDKSAARGAVPLEWFRWLPLRATRLFLSALGTEHWPANTGLPEDLFEEPIDRSFGQKLAAVDRLRADATNLRAGWLFVAGRSKDAKGTSARVLQPLVTVAVRVHITPARVALKPVGDVELSPLITDRAIREQLETWYQFGGGALHDGREPTIAPALLSRLDRLHQWATAAAAGAGFTVHELVPADEGPDELLRHQGLRVVAGVAVYSTTEMGSLSHAGSLASWAADDPPAPTAFHALYTSPSADAAARHLDDHRSPPDPSPSIFAFKPVSPFTLTPSQRRAVVSARSGAMTVVAGAPGTGKSHTIAAMACDALGRSQSVLIAAKAEATVDALLDLLERAPGLEPVVFGSNERRTALAARLEAGRVHPVDDAELDLARDALTAAVARRDAIAGDIGSRLRAEQIATGGSAELDRARAACPQLFDPATDLGPIGELLAVASHRGGGWLAGWRQRHAAEELDARFGAHTDVERRAVVDAYLLARAVRDQGTATRHADADGSRAWDALAAADDEVRAGAARWLAAESRSSNRIHAATLPAVGALATALRSGRAARRDQLSHLDQRLTYALPLWVGTLADIEDLLPRRAGLFDVVVLDEASSIDQPLAASALLRGRRGVIVGDPRQLRHVSFLADDDRQRVFDTNGVEAGSALAAKLDVRRNSTFDVAASVAPVLHLDEHFRGTPHLVDFVARRLYDGITHVATRSPATESIDSIDVVRVEGPRDKDGIVAAEVHEVIERLRAFDAQGERSVGVVSPFRAQAEAIEAAVLQSLDLAQIEALDLRVGTVHEFQGNEREIVIASIGIGTDGKPGSWRFVQDTHLFTVLVTRARRRFIVVHAADPPARGLVADYLAQADAPPGRPTPVPGVVPWATEIASDLAHAGVDVLAGYPTGRHVVDICVRGHGAFYGLECSIHPDGADAHIERHLSLRRAGWALREAFPSRWADRRGELLVELQADPPSARPSDLPGRQ